MNSKYIFNAIGALVLGIVLLPSASMAQVFKCKDASGKTAYQGTPCAAAQQESRPVILDSPTLTDEEKFNAAAYSAGMTPKEAKRLLQGDPASPGQPVAGGSQHEAERQNQQRVADCNRRYDKILRDNGSDWSRRHGLSVERDRSACIYGQAAGGARSSDLGGPSGHPVVAPRPSHPFHITSCDAGGCWDNLGNRYNGTGSTLFRTDGKTCNRVGGMLQCN